MGHGGCAWDMDMVDCRQRQLLLEVKQVVLQTRKSVMALLLEADAMFTRRLLECGWCRQPLSVMTGSGPHCLVPARALPPEKAVFVALHVAGVVRKSPAAAKHRSSQATHAAGGVGHCAAGAPRGAVHGYC